MCVRVDGVSRPALHCSLFPLPVNALRNDKHVKGALTNVRVAPERGGGRVRDIYKEAGK